MDNKFNFAALAFKLLFGLSKVEEVKINKVAINNEINSFLLI